MKQITKKLGVMTLALGMTVPALADVTLGVINVESVREKSSALKGFMEQMETARSKMQKNISEKEKKLAAEYESLSKSQSKLSEDAFNKKRAELEKKQDALRAEVMKKQELLRASYQKGMQEFNGAFQSSLKSVQEKENIDTLLPTQATLAVNTKRVPDLTDKVVSSLNASKGAISVDVKSLS